MPPTWFILFIIVAAAVEFVLRFPAVRPMLSTDRPPAADPALPASAFQQITKRAAEPRDHNRAAWRHATRRRFPRNPIQG